MRSMNDRNQIEGFMKFKTRVLELMKLQRPDGRYYRMQECIDALKARGANREWAEEYLRRKHLEGQAPEWLTYPKWFKKELSWCQEEGIDGSNESSEDQAVS